MDKSEAINHLTENVKNAITEFFVPLMTTKDVNETAFNELHELCVRMTNVLAGMDMIPREFLSELNTAIGILYNEDSAYHERSDDLKSMGDKLQWIYGTILSGESYSEPQPGAPRII
jgi:hypothetical protein